MVSLKTHLISIRVILLFSIAIFSTFIGDYFHVFLGDWKCVGSGPLIEGSYRYYTQCNYNDFHENTWHWGYRHWLYLTMCVILFALQAVEIIIYANSKYFPPKRK